MKRLLVFSLLPAIVGCTVQTERPADTNAGPSDSAISRLLPNPSDVRPWSPTDRRLSYDASTLSEFLDGGAETFLDYGFIRLVSHEYANGGESVVCTVYEMCDPEAAFGVFSALRSPEKERIELGDGGFRAEAQLSFWQARYYVTVETYTPRGRADRALESFSRAIATRIGEHAGFPAVMSHLPREGLLASTDRLLKGRAAANALAVAVGESMTLDAGTMVLAGDYRRGAATYRVLVVLAATPAGVDRVRALPGGVFTPAAGYVGVHSDRAGGASDTQVWTRRGRGFAAQSIDAGVRLVIDATRIEAARTALLDAPR